MEPKTFSERLRRCRMSAGLQGKDLAVRAGISGPYLTQLEKGVRAPSHELLSRLAESLQVSANWLSTGEHHDQPRLVPRSDHAGGVPDTSDALKARIAALESELAEAHKTIHNLSVALSQGRAGAVPAAGANCGSTRVERKVGA